MRTSVTTTLLFAALMVSGQELLQSARQKFFAEDWPAASKDFIKYLKNNDNDSSAWYGLGVCQLNLGDFDQSIKSLARARSTNFNSNLVDLQLAKLYAQQEQAESMYNTLESALQNNFFAYTSLVSDPEFRPYQDEDRFRKITEQTELNAFPCLSNENFRHFDFWIGEWDVYAGGRKVGENSITRAKGGCAIHENYITKRNYAGQSINFYSPVDKKWHQHWVGSAGDVYNYVETKRSEGLLQFESDFMGPTGQVSLSRLTFTLNEDGTVRQLFESSTDGGTTWTPAFDGLYKKRE